MKRRKSKYKPLIMVVDDEEDVVELVKRILESESYQVATAYNGDSARALLKRTKPDLIFLDILMPNIDGYTICSETKLGNKTKDIPVIMLTGLGYEINKELAKASGADGYITKPFSSKDLLDTIAKFLKHLS